MPLNVTDAESSFSNGLIEFKEWQDNFLARWYAPLAATQLAMLLGTMTDTEKATAPPDSLSRLDALKQKLTGGPHAK